MWESIKKMLGLGGGEEPREMSRREEPMNSSEGEQSGEQVSQEQGEDRGL